MCWDLEFPGASSSARESQLRFWSSKEGHRQPLGATVTGALLG